ncbi:hypothetical protein T484DRAFT_1802297 [Baffinella frigidus]|nr:hypothetical protein T484DRAFT_1802297 [Cryptophyta sp. CCMP2293]
MASDGLWDVMSSQTAVKVVHKFGDPTKAAKALVEFALQKGGNDNITAAVIDLRSIHSGKSPPEAGTLCTTEGTSDFMDISHNGGPDASKRVVMQAEG